MAGLREWKPAGPPARQGGAAWWNVLPGCGGRRCADVRTAAVPDAAHEKMKPRRRSGSEKAVMPAIGLCISAKGAKGRKSRRFWFHSADDAMPDETGPRLTNAAPPHAPPEPNGSRLRKARFGAWQRFLLAYGMGLAVDPCAAEVSHWCRSGHIDCGLFPWRRRAVRKAAGGDAVLPSKCLNMTQSPRVVRL